MNNFVNQQPYIRSSREFPEENKMLAQEVNKSYIDIANGVNQRIIGTYPTNSPAITGESWFMGGRRFQSARQIYNFTGTGDIPHYVNVLNIESISPRSYGVYLDSEGNYCGAIFSSETAIAGQISFYVTPNSAIDTLDGNIVIQAGADAPTIVSGIIDLEWIYEV